jgi:hypothetical protein
MGTCAVLFFFMALLFVTRYLFDSAAHMWEREFSQY